MRKYYFLLIASLISVCTSPAQVRIDSSYWPKEINTENYRIVIYQPQNESYVNNSLISRAAFSIKAKDEENLLFGAMWISAMLEVDRINRMASLKEVEVTEVRMAEDIEETAIERFRVFIEGEIPKWDIVFSVDEMLTSLEEANVQPDDDLATQPPLIIFTREPSVLVFIDGKPKLSELDKDYERVVNTATFIVKEKKSRDYYLSGGDYWYRSDNPQGPWEYQKKVKSRLRKLKEEHLPAEPEMEVQKSEKEDLIPAIVVSTEPAELVVIEGEAKFTPIQGTNLLYVENSESDLFMNVRSQNYFMLLSGRWFTASSTKGPWQYIASDQLPEDFSKIPEGSTKDAVLANVAGTRAAEEAKYDAYIPQTAAVDRSSATASVEYNGTPEFQQVENTSLQYAINTSSTVLKSGDRYYLCDNAVWFVAPSPNGPWEVSEERPQEVEKIPPSNPTYNVKYVYIYDVTPTVIYTGYTPGYTGCYVFGPTIVYGTGYYYRGWHGGYYYPRPVTYGFSFHYNPWTGWSMGFRIGFGSPVGWYGYGRYGYWGPRYYYPPIHHPRPPGGYYGPRVRPYYNSPRYRYNHNNYRRNVYNNRAGVRPATRPVARPSTRPGNQPSTRPGNQPSTRPGNQPSTRPGNRPSTRPGNRPSTRPGNQPSTRPSTSPAPAARPAAPKAGNTRNNVYSDRNGNVYQRDNNGNWQQRQNNGWSNRQNTPGNTNQLNKSYQNRQRSTQRNQNFNNYQRSAPARSNRRGRRGG